MTNREFPEQYRVHCGCGFDERFVSEVVATTVYSDHKEDCGYTTEQTEVKT